nr:MAG TPA: hypothetical protein [Bacteriophage sp.]
MRKLTIAEKREKELRRATETYNIEYDIAKKLKDLSLSCDRRIDKLNKDLEPYGLALDSFSHLMTIVVKGTTRTAIESFYYN